MPFLKKLFPCIRVLVYYNILRCLNKEKIMRVLVFKSLCVCVCVFKSFNADYYVE